MKEPQPGKGVKGQQTTMPQWPFQKIKREPRSASSCFLNMPWTPQGSVRTTETGNTQAVSGVNFTYVAQTSDYDDCT